MRLASGIRPGVFSLAILGFSGAAIRSCTRNRDWRLRLFSVRENFPDDARFVVRSRRGPRVEVRRPSAPVPVKLVIEAGANAVADGEVTKVVDGIPENTPRVLPKTVTLDNIAGNYVTVRIAANRCATYAHLQNGTLEFISTIKFMVEMSWVAWETAAMPLLRTCIFQLSDGNSVLQSEGVPFIFNKFTYLGPGSEYETDKHLSIPRDHCGNNDVILDRAIVAFAPARVSRTGAFSNFHFPGYSYPSPPCSPGASVHECHSSFSACASQNHLPHVGQCTVAGKSHGSSLGDTAWHKRSRFSLSPALSPISAPPAAISTPRFYAPILPALLG
jgi:hypothetical protein